jgi:hypothetical protein
MPIAEHVEIVRHGRAAIEGWSMKNPVGQLDCTEAHLANIDLRACDLRRVNFRGTDLSNAQLQHAILDDVDLNHANLTRAQLQKAVLRKAKLANANLHAASLNSADLGLAYLEHARLTEAQINHANFLGARVNNTDFQMVRGAPTATHLELVNTSHGPPLNFEHVVIPFYDDWFGWHRLRGIGRLPLFGLSYASVGLIWFWLYLLQILNNRISEFQDWAHRQSNASTEAVAQFILNHLQKEPAPLDWKLAFLSAFAIAIGSTIFSIRCPARAREFSIEQWLYEFNKYLIHYLPLACNRRISRLFCVFAYAVGFLLGFAVVARKVYATMCLIFAS